MTTRRSIFKFIPAMIAAAVLPKAWTARASEPNVGHVTLHEGMGKGEWTQYAHPFPLVGETGPEIIRQTGPAIRVYNDLVRDGYFDSGFYQLPPAITSNTSTTVKMNGPIRLFIDDPDGFSTEIQNVVSASIT